jgi:hypothetical protein
MKESDLYPALKAHLEAQGYAVKGEVNDCDVVAVRGAEEPVLVELKLNLNLSVMLQAVDRMAISAHVYVGVPADCSAMRTQGKRIVKLFRMSGLGLIKIDPKLNGGFVEVVLDPGAPLPRRVPRRKELLLREFERRHGDPNRGGKAMTRGVMTAYRQRALLIASYLSENGATKASIIAKALDEPKARTILYDNVYGWFGGYGGGVYDLTDRGREERKLWK